jgi:parvulin-like peptidyl-prolyl isomerase
MMPMGRLTLIVFALSFAAGCKVLQSEDVVARVGKATITQSEFREKIAEVSEGYQGYVLTPMGRRQFLDVLIREKLILEAARADGVERAPEFQETMTRLRREEERKLREAREHLLAKMWIEKLSKDGALSVPEYALEDYHKKNPLEVTVRHVLLATPKEAESVLKRARRGASFAALAEKNSLDADTAAEGGKMRPALRGEIIPELEVVFTMPVGEIAGPLRSSFGYHVVLKETQRKTEFSKVKDRVRTIVEKRKLDEHLQALRARHRVEVIDAQFQ